MASKWLSTADAMDHYGVSKRTLRHWATTDRISRRGGGRGGVEWEVRDDLVRSSRGRKANG